MNHAKHCCEKVSTCTVVRPTLLDLHFCVKVSCCRTLLAELPELAEGLPPLQRALAGSVLRPWCHFELPTSTYLAQGSFITSLNAALPGKYSNVALACEDWPAVWQPVLHLSCACPACSSDIAVKILSQERKVTYRCATRVERRRARDVGPRLKHQSAGDHVTWHQSAHLPSAPFTIVGQRVQRMC